MLILKPEHIRSLRGQPYTPYDGPQHHAHVIAWCAHCRKQWHERADQRVRDECERIKAELRDERLARRNGAAHQGELP